MHVEPWHDAWATMTCKLIGSGVALAVEHAADAYAQQARLDRDQSSLWHAVS